MKPIMFHNTNKRILFGKSKIMCEKEKKAPKAATEDTGRKILRRLQGEDGYDVFSDQKSEAEHQRYLREYEDERR